MNRKRFTLPEVLIAVALFATLAALASISITRSVKSWTAVKGRTDQLNKLIAMEKTLKPMVYNSIGYKWKIDGEDEYFFYGEVDNCQLVYRHELLEPDIGSLRFVKLAVEDGYFTANYDSRPWSENDGPDFDAENSSILAEGVEEVTFSYAGEDEENNKEITWFEEWTDTKLPLAIRILVVWENGIEENFLWRCGANSRFQRHFNQTTRR